MLFSSFLISVACAERPAVTTLRGEVLRQNGSPVAGATIAAVERAPWLSLGVTDTVVGRGIANKVGRFTLQVPLRTNISRLILVVGGEWERVKMKDGDPLRFGTSVPLERVMKAGLNRIIVPNSFRPVKQRPIQGQQ